jgi:hypothetical protein
MKEPNSIQLNPDGTLPTRPPKAETMTSCTSTWVACPHNTGWYFSVKFLFWTKKLYWCDLCHKSFDAWIIKAILRGKDEAK